MAVAIRLARGGAKKRPYYKIVVADARVARIALCRATLRPRTRVNSSGRLGGGRAGATHPARLVNAGAHLVPRCVRLDRVEPVGHCQRQLQPGDVHASALDQVLDAPETLDI